MASSSGESEMGAGNKRHRRGDGGRTDGRDKKRAGVSLSSGSGGTGDGDSGGVYGDDDAYVYEDEPADPTVEDDDASSSAACDAEPPQRRWYAVLTEADVRARQEADTAKVAEVLSVPAGLAAVLLRRARWRIARAQEDWFSDEPRARASLGLPPEAGGGAAIVASMRSPAPRACAICFDARPAGRTRAAGCGAHFYCDGCWRGYVRAAVADGARCLALRCPDPACAAPVVRELVDDVLRGADEDRARYARFWLRSYVEESGGGVKWCPGPGCDRAVERLGDADDAAAPDAFCACGHGFCWRCGEEAHRPVPCGTVRAWLAKNSSDSETANWVLANAKHCPKCRRPIEKNHGCNHMTCGAPCRHQFCWLCLDPWNDHQGCSRYDPRRQPQRQQQRRQAAAADLPPGGDQEEARRKEQAKASLDRYLYHYERWAANGKSLRKALADMDQLERSELERMAAAVDLPATELGFVADAYREIANGRRVLRWVHAYGYFLDPQRDAAKRGLFDDLQGQANRWLECLHACAELERKQLFAAAANGEPAVVAAEAFRAYREKVANLTGVTRKFLRNLVKAFETDLPEVAKPPFRQQIVNGPKMGRQTAGVGGTISTATAKVEPAGAVPPMVSSSAFSHATPMNLYVASQVLSTPRASSSSLFSQEANIGATPLQVHISNMMGPRTAHSFFASRAFTVSGNPYIAASSSQLNRMGMGQLLKPAPQEGLMTGLQLGQGRIGANQNVMSGLGPTTIYPGSAMMPVPGMAQQTAVDSLGVTNNSAMNVHTGQDPNAQQPPPKHVKLWEGTLTGTRQGQPVHICRLECYGSGTTSKTLVLDWTGNMQIFRVIARDYINNKEFVGRAIFLVFRPLNLHGFLQQLQERKLCAVIKLPSQTLLLSMSEKEDRMIGMLFPGDMVVFKPHVSTQQPPLQQHQLQQLQQQHMHMQPQSLHLQEHLQPQMQQLRQQQELPPKYVKIWEGSLSGQRQGQHVFICRLECYKREATRAILTVDWPQNMQIVRLIAQEHMNNKQYVGSGEFLVFRTLNEHSFFQNLQERKLCAVISLPSHTLMLSMSDKATRMIGMLFPVDKVVFKPQASPQLPTMP